MGEMNRNATGGWEPPVRGPGWWLGHKLWRKLRPGLRTKGMPLRENDDDWARRTSSSTAFAPRYRCDLCGEELLGEAAVEGHAESVHIGRTTAEARAAIRPIADRWAAG
jgi:hypothetical protein